MAKFIPSEFVEGLEYDFTEYGGEAGRIIEPSTGGVNRFFKKMKAMAKEVSKFQKTVSGIDIDEMDSEELADKLAKVDEAEEGASIYQQKTIMLIAELCGGKWVTEEDGDGNVIERVEGGSPSVDQLNLLPYRVLQAFNGWLIREITPKKTTPGTRN